MFVECGMSNNDYFKRNYWMEPKDINKFRFKHDNVGIYVSAYKYSTKDISEADISGDFYLDFDNELTGEEAFNKIKADLESAIKYIENIMRIDKDGVRVYFSGGKGFHLIVPEKSLGVRPHKSLNMVYKSIASDISKFAETIDTKIYDKRRLFRLENSIHEKSKLYKIPITPEEALGLSLKEVKELALNPRVVDHEPPKLSGSASNLYNNLLSKWQDSQNKITSTNLGTLKVTPPCIKSLLENPVLKGQRNNTSAALCSFFKQQGLSKEEAESRLKKWNEEQCSPKISNKEVESTANSIYAHDYKFGCTTMKDLSSCFPERCDLIHK